MYETLLASSPYAPDTQSKFQPKNKSSSQLQFSLFYISKYMASIALSSLGTCVTSYYFTRGWEGEEPISFLG